MPGRPHIPSIPLINAERVNQRRHIVQRRHGDLIEPIDNTWSIDVHLSKYGKYNHRLNIVTIITPKTTSTTNATTTITIDAAIKGTTYRYINSIAIWSVQLQKIDCAFLGQSSSQHSIQAVGTLLTFNVPILQHSYILIRPRERIDVIAPILLAVKVNNFDVAHTAIMSLESQGTYIVTPISP
jgi:hypothetical protein